MMSFRPCKMVHTFPSLKCSKIKYLVFIPTVCLILSCVISFTVIISIADTVLTVSYQDLYTNSYATTNLYDSKPSWDNANYFHIDLTSYSDDIVKYWYVRNTNFSKVALAQVSCYFDALDYDSFTSGFISVDSGTSTIDIKYYDANNSSIYSKNIEFRGQAGSYNDDFLSIIWNDSPASFTDGNNHTAVFNIVSFSSMILYPHNDLYRIKITYDCRIPNGKGNYTEVILPLMNVYGSYIGGGGETSDESGGNSQWQDDLTDQLDQMTEIMEDVVSGIGGVQSEVSQLGDDISQGFSDLNSAEESRHNELMNYLTSNEESLEVNSDLESELEEFEDTTSIYNEYEQSLDNIIDGALSDFSYDTSEFYDNINNAFSELNNDTSDISFVAFVESLWNFTGISTFLPIIGGFMVLAVLLKFVIGGVV